MNEPASKPLRTWRPIALWTAAILLALGLAGFVGSVVVPLAATHRALEQGGEDNEINGDQVIDDLGGADRAARRLAFYLRMPDSIASRRAVAAYELGLCERRGVAVLLRCLRDTNPRVRAAAAMGLALAEPSAGEAAPGLIGMLADPVPRVRMHAAMTIGSLAGSLDLHEKAPPEWDPAVPVLLGLLQDEDPDVREFSAEALGHIRRQPDRVIPALGRALGDADREVRWKAVCALENFGPAAKSEIPVLQRCLSDRDPTVRADAARALKRIRGEGH